MNLLISNENYKITDTLNVEIIKTLKGEFLPEQIQKEIVNFYFNKAIIDITAIKNYYNINSVLLFLNLFTPENTILLLNESEVVNSYLNILVENGYYNFTKNAAGINYLINNPNTYEDVKKYIKTPLVSETVSQQQGSNNAIDKFETSFEKKNNNQKIIGVQNLTEHAGATSLAYMMIKQLKLNYTVKGIEMNKQDFIYFKDSDLVLCTRLDELKLKLKEFSKIDVVIIDLNNFDAEEVCDEIIYLVDPGIVRLNKLIKSDNNIYLKVSNGKVILNRSSIKEEEISNFEYETKFKIFYNMPNFNDRRERLQVIDKFLYKLGFKKQNPEIKKVFNIFNITN